MKGKPVTVRLLDPPIHEFLPTADVIKDELEHLRNLRGTVSGVTDLFSSLRLIDGDLSMVNRAAEPFLRLPAWSSWKKRLRRKCRC